MSALDKTIERREDHPAGRGAVAAHCSMHSAPSIKPASYFRWKGRLDRVCPAAVLLVPAVFLIVAVLVALVRLYLQGAGHLPASPRRQGWPAIHDLQDPHNAVRRRSVHRSGLDPTSEDRRVTPVGGCSANSISMSCRNCSDVMKGDMALVGPRPERPEFVCVLAEAVPGYRNRLAVCAGITRAWRKSTFPPDSDLLSVQRKVVLDCEYVDAADLGSIRG